MNYKALLLLCFISISYTLHSQDTFSIIAVDPSTGEIGSAGASCVDGAGDFGGIIDIITKIIPGRGGVNSQAYVCIPNTNLNNAIAEMENGASPSEIIDFLLNNDACSSQGFDPAFRQYGIADLDTSGDPRTAGFTGNMADDYKEDRQGATYSIQGNILLNQTVIDNMESNFNTTTGSLADKLMAAMQGANFAGADSRCLARGTSSTSAYLLVYRPTDDASDPYLRLNIEEMPFGEEPIDSLQTLYDKFLGVNDIPLKNQLNIAPNPVRNNLTLQWNDTMIWKEITVYDILGKRVETLALPELGTLRQTWNMDHLRPGMYFLKVATASDAATLSFIKE
ncbi:MAG: secretion protein [Flavobacteriaceae bacterium]|nr:secretion protein [Flavobacteriaceae bacterium]|tara:strand:- start:2942 stop:3955 length:1014 start_codon:yes stop_codon:yes gene_type:complete